MIKKKQMKKEYVKPQNQVVVLSDYLLEDVIHPGTIAPGQPYDAKQIDFEDDFDSDDSPKNLWDD